MAIFEAIRIHKRFGSRVVLEDVSLSYEQGEIGGIMGPNGAGKTTCFNVLTGRHAPDRGAIRFEGQDITGQSPQAIARRGIARSFQIMNLFDHSVVIENIIVALPEFRARQWQMMGSVFDRPEFIEPARNILAMVGLGGKEREPSAALSYGERRALEIGVALAARPRVLFLDEPTSGLGSEGTQNLAALIRKLRRQYTIVMIEHDMRFLFDLADRISVIHWGQVIAEGPPDVLARNKWVQRSALGELA
jgi:branched-chain amino acid transport system ATP-binding protein